MPRITTHWKESVRGMSYFTIKKVFMEVDRKLYDQLVSDYPLRLEERCL